jgi:hypothetical protein
MKLYEVPNYTMVRLVPETEVKIPVGSTLPTDVFKFHKIDGMYSYCTTADGTVVHPAAWTEVEVVK